MSPAVWLLLAALVPPVETPLTVSAAVSLTEALSEISVAYEAAGGVPVRFNFAASNVLARQIVNGAPADVFVSADAVQMDVAERAGAVDTATRVNIIGNRLAVLVRAGLPVAVRGPRDLAQPDIRRISLGNPDAVPAGVYAREFLRAAGVWESIERKVVPVSSVRAALAAVETGSADAAIVYETDTLQAHSAQVAFVASAAGPDIVYPAAVVSRTRRRQDSLRFIAYLQSAAAVRVFRRYRFHPIAR